MIKICKNCGKEFDAKFEKYTFCSRSCATHFRHKDPAYTKNIKDKVTATKNTDACREQQRASAKKHWKELKENDIDRYNDRVNRLQTDFSAWNANDENKLHLSSMTRNYFDIADNKKRLSEQRKEYFKNPDNVEKQRCINKEIQNRPEVRKKQRSHWLNDEYANNRLYRMYKFKEYVMPSGVRLKYKDMKIKH